MADDKGIIIASNIVPMTSDDGIIRSHATHIAKYGKGGWREVATLEERDTITAPRREAGMAVFVTSEAKLYILNEDLETWTEFKAGSSDGIRKTSSFDDFIPLYDGEIVEYVGEDTDTEESGSGESYVNGYFYQCNYYHTYIDASRVVRSASGDLRVHVELEGEDGFLQSGLQTNTDYTFVRNRGFWECTDPEGITILGNRAGLRIDSSIVNNNDTVILRVEELSGYTFDQKNVQPATQLVWGNIEGTLSNQTDLQNALEAKLDKVSTTNRVYGTDDQGNQTTYDKNSFGQVDDVQIHGDSKVVNKVANLLVAEQCDQTTMPVPSQDLLGRIVQYIGPNGLVSGYVHGYFYECQSVTTESYIELEVIKQPGTQLDTVTCDKDLLEANQGATRDSSWDFISHGGWNEWYLDDEHIDLNDWGIAYQGEPSEDDEIYLEYYKAKTSYKWVAIPVQPDAQPITSQQIEDLWS